jgi:Clp protease/NB-ARC domain
MESRDISSNAPDAQHAPTSIVCLYATCDEPMYRDLQAHLVLWRTKGHIRWLELSAGADVEQTLLAFIQEADCVLLLISSSFFATSVYHRVMENALAKQAKRGVAVIPILARAFDWKESACGSLKALPDNELPIAEWEYQERAYENIRAGLVRLIPGLAAQMGSLSTRPKHFQARALPKGYVPRPKAFDEIKRLLLNYQNNQTTAITTALRGAGGFGKTTLALALCHDSEIQAAFPDGILWVELGEHPPEPLDLLIRILASLEPSLKPSLPELMTLEKARELWRTALDGRVCLLVIDDVWQAVVLRELLAGGPRCVRLVTTRNDQVLPEETARIFVDAMETEEAIAVLRRGLPEEVEQSALEALVTRLGCWPLLLTLAHGLLLDQVRYGRTMAQALEVVEHIYQQRGVTAFHLEQVNERYQTVERCLEVSLRHLEEFTLARYQAATRYQELAIFPEDMDIPIVLLRRFWQGAGGLEAWETDELCVRLHQLSLLLTCDLGKGTIRLHDVMRNYLVQCAGTKLSTLHARFSSILLEQRAIYIDTPIDDNVANSVVAQLLYLQSKDATKDITMYIYINSPKSLVYAGLAIYDTMQWLTVDVSTVCVGQAIGFGAILLSAGAKGKRFALPGSTIQLLQPLREIDHKVRL